MVVFKIDCTFFVFVQHSEGHCRISPNLPPKIFTGTPNSDL